MPSTFDWFFFITALGSKGWEHDVYYVAVDTPLGEAAHRPPRVGTIMGSLMMEGAHLGPIGTRVMAMDEGWSSWLVFSHMLNLYVPTIFCHLWYISCWEWPNYAFSFQLHQPLRHHSKPDPRCGQERGRLTLCGPNWHMWTQMGK